MARKSTIKSKQLDDNIVKPEHVSTPAKYSILNTKKAGIARIIEGIDIQQNDNEIEITEEIFDAVYNSQFTITGTKEGVRTTGNINPVSALDEKGKGFANYKVWLRRNGSRLAINNGVNNNEVFGELYIKEFFVDSHGYEYAEANINATQNSTTVNLFNIEPSEYDEDDYVGGILTTWNGNDDTEDYDIGIIQSVTGIGRSRTITLTENSPRNYGGVFKVIRYYLKFYTYDGSGNIIDYNFLANSTIDVLFVESLDSIYEETNNLYNYTNFYKILDYPDPTPTTYLEKQLVNINIYETSSSGDPVEYVTFQVPESVFNEGSMEIFIDGVRIPRWQSGDPVLARRIVEEDPENGLVKILNFIEDDLLYEEVYAKYFIDESGY